MMRNASPKRIGQSQNSYFSLPFAHDFLRKPTLAESKFTADEMARRRLTDPRSGMFLGWISGRLAHQGMIAPEYRRNRSGLLFPPPCPSPGRARHTQTIYPATRKPAQSKRRYPCRRQQTGALPPMGQRIGVPDKASRLRSVPHRRPFAARTLRLI